MDQQNSGSSKKRTQHLRTYENSSAGRFTASLVRTGIHIVVEGLPTAEKPGIHIFIDSLSQSLFTFRKDRQTTLNGYVDTRLKTVNDRLYVNLSTANKCDNVPTSLQDFLCVSRHLTAGPTFFIGRHAQIL